MAYPTPGSSPDPSGQRARRDPVDGHGVAEDGSACVEAAECGVVGARLRAARRARSWTLEEVEAGTGGEIRTTTLSAYERGTRAIPLPRLLRLAALYGIGVTDLLAADGATPTASVVVEVERPRAGTRRRESLGREGLTGRLVISSGGHQVRIESVDLHALRRALDAAIAAASGTDEEAGGGTMPVG